MSLAQGKSVLIVDDTAFMRHLVRRALTPLEFDKYYEGTNGDELLKLYAEKNPDLVISDIIMDKKDGLTAIRELFRVAPAARVLVVSAIDVPSVFQECIDMGVVDFVVKPFTSEGLVHSVLLALSAGVRHNARQKTQEQRAIR